jgi:hypothetical protein
MYRDLIEAPQRVKAHGTEWWVQVFRHWDGSVMTVILYDEEGEPVGEFDSLKEVDEYIRG